MSRRATAGARLPVGVSYWVGETGIVTRQVRQQLGKTLGTTPTNAKRWAERLRVDPNSTLHVWGAREGQAPQYLGSKGRETGGDWKKLPRVIKELPMGGDLASVQIIRSE